MIRGEVYARKTPIIEDSSQTPHLIEERRVISDINRWWVHPIVLWDGEDELLEQLEG